MPGAPKIKFLNKEIAKRKKNASHVGESGASPATTPKAAAFGDESEESEDDEEALSEHSSSEEDEPRPSTSKEQVSEKVRT